ncbi:hypothetical protein CBM2589_A90565 [Cupriavidus taiwanensis]|uniref:Uncharacterized protein n=1 Tax=Cupriavidus taiwanensis TaxID=164546 RepID=A0A976A9I2_9BURK|nr:hypothetical protein CBM2589_A90565 [Cupriavidus taiwanensis]
MPRERVGYGSGNEPEPAHDHHPSSRRPGIRQPGRYLRTRATRIPRRNRHVAARRA